MRQIDFVLQKRNIMHLNCALVVKIHAWLMTQVDPEYAKSMHTPDELRPYSMFVRVQQNNIALRVSGLHETATPLLEAMRAARVIDVSGLDGGIAILDRIEKPVVPLAQLSKPVPKEFQIIVVSPATYKSNHRPCNLYSLPPLLYTGAAKLRKFEGVDISNAEVSELCGLVSHSYYELHTAEYKIKPDVVRPGFEGKLVLRPGGDAAQRAKLAILLRYAAYAGVGAKTALGMGGILLSEM